MDVLDPQLLNLIILNFQFWYSLRQTVDPFSLRGGESRSCYTLDFGHGYSIQISIIADLNVYHLNLKSNQMFTI